MRSFAVRLREATITWSSCAPTANGPSAFICSSGRDGASVSGKIDRSVSHKVATPPACPTRVMRTCRASLGIPAITPEAGSSCNPAGSRPAVS
jgi:hypothetical protein